MRQVLGAGALGRPRGMGWGGRREQGSGWGTHVNPWLTHVNVWQKPLQYCKVIGLQLIKINGKNKNKIKSVLWKLKKKEEDSDLNFAHILCLHLLWGPTVGNQCCVGTFPKSLSPRHTSNPWVDLENIRRTVPQSWRAEVSRADPDRLPPLKNSFPPWC